MDCAGALRKLSQYLDHELEEIPSSELTRHLNECRGCFSLAEFEQRLRAIILRSCRGDQIPSVLEDRLVRLLRSF